MYKELEIEIVCRGKCYCRIICCRAKIFISSGYCTLAVAFVANGALLCFFYMCVLCRFVQRSWG